MTEKNVDLPNLEITDEELPFIDLTRGVETPEPTLQLQTEEASENNPNASDQKPPVQEEDKSILQLGPGYDTDVVPDIISVELVATQARSPPPDQSQELNVVNNTQGREFSEPIVVHRLEPSEIAALVSTPPVEDEKDVSPKRKIPKMENKPDDEKGSQDEKKDHEEK